MPRGTPYFPNPICSLWRGKALLQYLWTASIGTWVCVRKGERMLKVTRSLVFAICIINIVKVFDILHFTRLVLLIFIALVMLRFLVGEFFRSCLVI